MKAVTEFAVFTLNKALASKATLTAEGKSAEEIQVSLGTSFKLEGEKLGYFMTALEVASQNQDKLKRVLVVRLNEGEAAPAKAHKVEDIYYVPEFLILTPASATSNRSSGKGRGNRQGGPKGSPWGLSPEEKAAKKGASLAAAAKAKPETKA